jgi:DNA-binding CsgD family transcriptional regulator
VPDRAGPPDTSLIRGRAAEYEVLLSLLRSTEEGQGKILLVEGDPGTGKSLLLATAAREAGQRGFPLVAAAADELSQATPLAPLLTALHASMALPQRSSRHHGPAAAPAAGAPMVLAGLEELASAGPVLVTVDDVQWADPATVQAFRSMPRLLASYPLSWILTMARSPHASNAELLFDLLERDGATRMTLEPLDHEAQVALISDVLGAVPDAKLIELAASASGNPFILTEAFRGLLDENAVTVCGGQASLASAHVPRRIQTLARDRLKGLSVRAREFTQTASILGSSFRLEDVAEILSESPGALLAAVNEALSAHLLVATPDGLAFQYEFVRRAVAQMLPEPIQQALHWQFGQMLLARGGSAVPAADHLLTGARPGDAVALAGLDRAVAELLPFAAQAAADLATGALVLTLPSDPRRSARTATTVRALMAAGQWDAAETLVRSALAVPLPALDSAALRCALSSLLGLTGRAADAMIEAQAVLANFEITPDLRDDATIALLWAWLGLRANEQVDQMARAILAQPSTKSAEVVVAAMVALAMAMWDAGRPAEALDLAAQAARKVAEGACDAAQVDPRLLLASQLIDVGQINEATAIVDSVGSIETSAASPWPEGITAALRARIALAEGRLDDAVALAESALRSAGATGPFGHDALVMLVLATVALRRGDLRMAAEYAERLSARGHCYGLAYLTEECRMVAARVLEARHGPRAALDFLADVLADLPEHRSVLLADPANAPWLVRVALAAGDRGQAQRIDSVVSEMSRSNPMFMVIRASAEYASGLLASDVTRLQHAAVQLPDPWARSCAAEDLGVLLAAAGRHDEAARALDGALREYARLGAKRDGARTRRMLRELGVRHRHWATEKRPAIGWESLTDTEQATASLVAQGLRNQQIANQLFISTHTVAFHLRQVFRKLDIRSRVELTRIALEHAQPENETPPHGHAPGSAMTRHHRAPQGGEDRRGLRARDTAPKEPP